MNKANRILLVDDDPIVVRIYREGLVHLGLEVETAGDGISALSSMHASKPDLVVLDLMMPRLSGQEVLRLMKEKPALASIPVIILSNSYMSELNSYATTAGSVKSLLKAQCNPAILYDAIAEVLANRPAEEPSVEPAAEPAAGPSASEPAHSPISEPVQSPEEPVLTSARAAALAQSLSPFAGRMHEAEVRERAREEFLSNATAHCTALRNLFHAFANASEEQLMFRLEDLYRKVHFLTATAGLAECHHLSQMAAVFEAMLFQMMDQPSRITPSVLRTSAMAIDFIQMLFSRAAQSPGETPLPEGRVLVVDDDPVCTRLVMWALQQAHLQAQSARDANEALQMLETRSFDLVLLDVGLPDMDGIQFCKLLRSMPACRHIPVIHCTSHTDFQTRTQSALSGGDDFISKPVLPMELALKAVMHLIERQKI